MDELRDFVNRAVALELYAEDPNEELQINTQEAKIEKDRIIAEELEDMKQKMQALHEWRANQKSRYEKIGSPLEEKRTIDYPNTTNTILEDLDHINGDVITFWRITERMTELYSRKNRDYGNSFSDSLDKDGLLVSKIILNDKMNRFEQLLKRDPSVKGETIKDTLIDIANYAVITMQWLEDQE